MLMGLQTARSVQLLAVIKVLATDQLLLTSSF